MGLLNLFKKKLKIVDDLFGELDYTTFKDSTKNFYNGRITIDAQLIGILLEADENGPDTKQKDFFKALRNNYTTFKNGILIPFLKLELHDWIEKNQLKDFETEFKIDSIFLFRVNHSTVKWSLTLYSLKIDHYLTITFNDLIPEGGIVIDG